MKNGWQALVSGAKPIEGRAGSGVGRRLLRLALVTFVLSGFSPGFAGVRPDAVVLVLRPECTVTGSVVRLADVVVSASQRSLLDLELGKAPAPGAFARLSAAYIRTRVEQATGSGAEVRVVGPDVVRVRRAAQTLTQEQVATAILQRVSRDLPAGARAEVELVHAPNGLTLPAGELLLRAEPLGAVRPGQLGFRVECVVNGAVARTFAVTARVRVYQKVLVAAVDIPARSRVGLDAVRVEERPLTRRLDAVLTDPAQAVGKETRVRVRRGTVLTQRLLRQIPLVRRGERVRLVVKFHNVTAETYGRALQEGAADATVLVRNEGSGRTVQGRVVGPGVVVVAP